MFRWAAGKGKRRFLGFVFRTNPFDSGRMAENTDREDDMVAIDNASCYNVTAGKGNVSGEKTFPTTFVSLALQMRHDGIRRAAFNQI